MSVYVFLVVFIFLCLVAVFKTIVRGRKLSIAGLPGPKGLPFIGSIHELEAKNPWLTFAKWGNQYGPIYQVNLGGSNHVWISSERIAHELLAKKGSIYSDRPHIPALLDDNRTSGQYLPLLSKNDQWTRQRKFTRVIMTAADKNLMYGYPELESIRLLTELIERPSEYNHSLESFISRVTCRLAWGRPEASDELKQRARELLISVSPTGALGNKLPFVMSLPDWLSPPKAWERRRARTERSFFRIMQREVAADLKANKASPSWMRTFFEAKPSMGFKDDLEGAYAVGMHGIAGALTVAAPMQVWCMAMAMYPQYLAMIQRELDQVCGDRLPTYSDMPNLPVLRASIRETMRWRPPVPTGIPHELSEDDIWNGYYIPKGSIMHALEWSISRDPAMYPNPEMYNPLRWLSSEYPTYKEPLSQHPTICQYSQFGFGRRICMGQEVATADLLVGIGSMAWALNIRTKRDPLTGLEIPIDHLNSTELLIDKPKWFDFDIQPRSEKRAEHVRKLYEERAAQGCYAPAKKYWDEKNPQLGWAKP